MNDRNSPDLFVEAVDAAGAETDQDQFEYRDGNSIFSIKVGDIDPSELRMRYNSTKLWVEVHPVCHGFLIPTHLGKTIEKLSEKGHTHLENNLELHWSDCTAPELITLIVGWFEEQELSVSYHFPEFVKLLVTPVAEGLIRLRDTHRVRLSTEIFFEHLLLERYEQYSTGDCPPSFDADAFKPYLDALPGYKRGCPSDSEPKAYSIHGYILMHLVGLMRDHAAGVGKYRRERIFSLSACFPSIKPIISAKADLRGKMLIVELTHPAPDDFVKLELSSAIPDHW
jgi:hypothetical protein